MPSKFIKLAKPLTIHGQQVVELELKEPSGGDYVRLGDPRILVFNTSGSGYWVPRDEVIQAYLEKNIVSELGSDVINLLTIKDVMNVKEGLYSFFTDAANGLSET